MRRLLLVIALLAFAACGADEVAEDAIEQGIESQDGSGDVEVDVDSDDGSMDLTIESDEGDASVSIGGGELPENFPWDVPSGGEVQAVSTSSQGNVVAIRYPGSAFDDVVNHFQKIVDSEASADLNTQSIASPPVESWSWNLAGDGFVSISVQQQSDITLVSIIYDG